MAVFDNSTEEIIITGTSDADSIVNSGIYVTVQARGGDDHIYNNGDSVTIDGGKGNDNIANFGASAVIDGGDGYDTITNTGDSVTIDSGSGNDTIDNDGNNVTINSGAGNDFIKNGSFNYHANIVSGNDVLIKLGEGNDTIYNYDYSANVTIDGGAGNDSIRNGYGNKNTSKNSSIKGGDGLDTIDNYSANVTIDGGAGNDSIYNRGSNVVFKYSSGDGNDSICGFNETSTLSITGATYSSLKSGDDFILTVGTGKITLQGAANFSKINIIGKTNEPSSLNINNTVSGKTITGTAYADTIANSGASVTIDGGADSDEIISGKSVFSVANYVTINGGEGNDRILIYSHNTSIGGGTGTYSSAKSGDNLILTVGTGSITLIDAANLSKLNILGKENSAPAWKLNGTTATYGNSITVTGVKSLDSVSLNNKTVTISNAALNQGTVTISDGYTLALGSDVAKTSTTAAKWKGSGSTYTYTAAGTSAGYKLSGNKISYTSATGGQNITIKNLNTAATLSTIKNGVTVAEKSGTYNITFKNFAILTTKAPTISVAKGLKYTVAVADSLKPVTKSAWTVSGTTATFRTNTTAGYSVNSKNAVVYSAQKTGSPLLELGGLSKGVKASSIAAPKNKVVTLNANVLGANSSVKSNGGGYTLNLAGNMSGKKFVGSAKVDTLTVAANNANVDSGAGNDVVTVSGLKVTLSGGAGNDTLTGGKNVDLLYGGSGNDSILGNAGNDKLFGQDGNDTLRGGAGNDTLSGGKGNDSLWGDAGKDTFLYSSGDGKDIIYGFDGGDLLQITGTFSASYNKSKKEIAFKVGSTANAITLRDFTATSFNVNGDIYSISNNKFIKK